jgi:bifunctional non-homologous end joining protein LigD
MLATAADRVPAGPDWLFEVKWDGYRALAYVSGGRCELESRNTQPLTGRFPALAREIAMAVTAPSTVLDGEVCALDAAGRPSFSALQDGSGALAYFAFDLLEQDGESLVDLPIEERRERLAEVIARSATVRVSTVFDDGEALLAAAVEQQLEGVVAKRLGSRYAEGRRTRDWLKIKTQLSDDFVVVGYTRGSGSRASTFGSLLLAVREGDDLRYAGNVGTGFGEAEIRRLLGELEPLVRAATPLPGEPKLPRVRRGDIVWVEPTLLVEVEYRELTREGRVRQASYKGRRTDL